jgi:[ribosomal protein S5]-alanine N-acetyltransferase
MNQPSIETARLVLRPYSLADVSDLVRLAGAREVAATTLRIPHPYREEDAINFITACHPEFEMDRCVRFAITLRSTAEFCGGVGLRMERWQQQAELGYWLGVSYWGKGYATECARAVVDYGFDTLKLHRIYASYLAHNVASSRVLQKIGMKYEGCMRGHVLKWNTFYDAELYGMLRTDLAQDQ